MRSTRWLATITALAGLLTAATLALHSPPAAAQQVSVITLSGFGSGSGAGPQSVTNIPAQASGQIAVTFAGDPAAGCAAHGLCGYSGTVMMRPGANGQITIGAFRHRGRTTYQAGLFLGGGSPSGLTAANVVRSTGAGPPGTCGDARPSLGQPAATVERGIVDLPLFQAGGTLLSNRCAGPRDGDLTGTGPSIKLPLGRLMRGRSRLDLGGTWSFTAGGFSGTVRSTLTLALGAPHRQSATTSPSFPKGVKTTQMRQLTETLTVTRAQGTLDLAVAGTTDPTVCALLDSCGVAETLNGVLLPQHATAELSALGPASRPYGDFLAALGLSRHGNPKGINVAGTLSWSPGGSVTARLGQSQSCTDTAPLGGGLVLFLGSGGRLSANFESLAPALTRCPGPIIAPNVSLGSGMIGASQLGGRTFALRIDGRRRVEDDGYTVSSTLHLSFTLRRGGMRQQLQTVPTG